MTCTSKEANPENLVEKEAVIIKHVAMWYILHNIPRVVIIVKVEFVKNLNTLSPYFNILVRFSRIHEYIYFLHQVYAKQNIGRNEDSNPTACN